MGKRLKIGVDVDGVLADFTGHARKLCQRMFNGRPADALVQTGWGFDSLGISPEQEDEMWRTIDATRDWWLYLAPLDETHLITPLVKQHEVIFITNRKQGTGLPVEVQTAEWLTRVFNLFHPTVLLSSKKGPLAKALGLDYFIDDRDKNVIEVADAIGPQKVVMNRWPWQPEFQKFHPYWVHNFNEFAEPLLDKASPLAFGVMNTNLESIERCVA